MRLTTWNVNGIRNPFSYPPWNNIAPTGPYASKFPGMFDALGSDIVVMQEVKIQRKDLRDDMVLLDGWDAYFSLPKHKKGYSGVGIYTRNATCAPIRAEEGLLGVLPSQTAGGTPYCEMPEGESIAGYPSPSQVEALGVDPVALDAEGRCLILEFPAFVLFGVYCPANSNGLRDDFRHAFIIALDTRIRNLIALGKNVVLVGDLNVSRDESDTAKAVEDCRKNGVTHEEYISTPNRRIFNQLLIGGEVAGPRDGGREDGVLWDTTRAFHPQRHGMYTHWEQKINARPGNFGSRIDFVLVSEAMQSWVKDANIQEGLLGSDHCPVFADFQDEINVDGRNVKMVDVMNPANTFKEGTRLLEWKVQNVPAFSAKRMPEFDKRRSIKSMFFKKSDSSAETEKPVASLAIAGEQMTTTEAVEATQTLHTNGDTPDQPRLVSLPSQDVSQSHEHPTTTKSSAASFAKRKASVPAKEKPFKKQKSDSNPQASKGQQSLKGFFAAQSKSANESPTKQELDGKSNGTVYGSQAEITIPLSASATADPSNGTPPRTQPTPSASQSFPHSSFTGPTQSAYQSPSPTSAVRNTRSSPSLSDFSPSKFSSQIAANEQTQRAWGNLFTKPVAPLCEGHAEPCKSMQTKKKGSNQGRSFWMCARPLGPSGEKEKGTEWRCGTFIWCSDWDGGKKAKEGVGGRGLGVGAGQ